MKLILKKLLLTTAASIKGSSINTNSSLDKKENKLVEQFLTWNNQLCIAIFYTADKFCEILWQRYISVYFFCVHLMAIVTKKLLVLKTFFKPRTNWRSEIAR